MKTWIMMRHGKSSWEYNLPDINRPLSKRGENDSKKISSLLKQKQIIVDYAFSSPALRAKNTAEIVLNGINHPKDLYSEEPLLYDFQGDNVLNFVKNLDNKISIVMTFGHNSACTNIFNTFSNKYVDNIPTAGIVIFHFKVSLWSSISDASTEHFFPKLI